LQAAAASTDIPNLVVDVLSPTVILGTSISQASRWIVSRQTARSERLPPNSWAFLVLVRNTETSFPTASATYVGRQLDQQCQIEEVYLEYRQTTSR
jgi:hypothetical protein